MVVTMTLDRPLLDAQRLVESPKDFIQEILQTIETAKSHPVISQMLKPDLRDDPSYYEVTPQATAAAREGQGSIRLTQNPLQPPEPEQ